MTRYLTIDIGAGTMDMLYVNDADTVHYKAIVESPVRTEARRVAGTPGALVITGGEMGGGPVSSAIEERAKQARVVMSASAARTLDHDLDRVAAKGIQVAADDEALAIGAESGCRHLAIGDIDPVRIGAIVAAMGVDVAFDVVAVCAQDHGMPPRGESHLDYRHRFFTDRLDCEPYAHRLLYAADEVPPTLNRLRTIAEAAARLPTEQVFVMDSGMAAICGAPRDRQAADKDRLLVLDVATSHTVGATLQDGRIAGFFEYHTRDVSGQIMDRLMTDLAAGDIDHHRILAAGGHGAYIREPLPLETIDLILATGPKRRLVADSQLPVVYGAPWGDNMITGCVGMIEAVRRRQGLAPIVPA